MSAGKFISSKYSTDAGVVHRIRIQPETVTSVNTVPSGSVTGLTSAYARKGNRRYGVGARTITIKWNNTIPDGYDSTSSLVIPILQKTVFDGLSLGGAFTYLGVEGSIIGKANERIR